MPIVYCATNRINKKRYIGVTCRTLEVRKREHLRDCIVRPYCRIFSAALKKYGPDSFDWKILERLKTAEEAYEAEFFYIDLFKPEYNISIGGRLGTLGLIRTQEWNDNISKGLLGRELSPEHRKKAIAGCALGRSKRHRPVVCLEDGNWFCGMRQAEVFYGMPKASLRNIFDRGQTKTHSLHFVESKKKLSQKQRLVHLRKFEARVQLEKDRLKRGFRSRAVRCLPERKDFKSVRDAAAHYGLSTVTINVKLKTGEPTVRHPKGLMFQYVS